MPRATLTPGSWDFRIRRDRDIVVAVIVEEGQSGSGAAVPVARAVF